MPSFEKEYNGNLLDQLDIVEDTLEIANEENAPRTVAFLTKRKKQIERKLYQKPPVQNNNQ